MVVGPGARGVAKRTNAAGADTGALPGDWLRFLKNENAVVGEPYRDGATRQPVMIVAVPIYPSNGRLIGALTAKLNLRAVQQITRRFATAGLGGSIVVTADGTLLAGSGSGGAARMAGS